MCLIHLKNHRTIFRGFLALSGAGFDDEIAS